MDSARNARWIFPFMKFGISCTSSLEPDQSVTLQLYSSFLLYVLTKRAVFTKKKTLRIGIQKCRTQNVKVQSSAAMSVTVSTFFSAAFTSFVK